MDIVLLLKLAKVFIEYPQGNNDHTREDKRGSGPRVPARKDNAGIDYLGVPELRR